MSLHYRLYEANLTLPSDFLEKAIKQIQQSPTRRRLRKGGSALAGPKLPPIWGYLSTNEKKEWLKKQQNHNKTESLHDKVFTEDWKTVVRYAMSTSKNYDKQKKTREKKKPMS